MSPWRSLRHSPGLRRSWWAPACLVAALATSQLGATDCNGVITRDPGFDLWCGDALCAWKLERGDVRRVPTWHEADSGVELLDTGTAIEQFTAVNHTDSPCIRFDLIADVAEAAQAELAIDVYGDGSIERTFPIPTAHWRPLSYAFAVKPPFTGIRFELAKRGTGRAVMARMRAVKVDDGCPGVPELDGGPAPLGALCTGAGDCASNQCIITDIFGTKRCTGCDLSKPMCAAGQVCGFTDPVRPERGVPITCVPAGTRVLGEQCVMHAECTTGNCVNRVCSTCRPQTGCSSGAACAVAYIGGPSVCGPGAHLGPPGAPCASDGECASGLCNGPPRRQCMDGRSCATDANCPVDGFLVPGPCSTVGVQGGSCN